MLYFWLQFSVLVNFVLTLIREVIDQTMHMLMHGFYGKHVDKVKSYNLKGDVCYTDSAK